MEALLPTAKDKKEGLREIPVKEISPNPRQTRQVFEKEALRELAASIKEVGLVQPIIVRRSARGYELVSGERRLRAFKHLGEEMIPALVREMDEEDTAAAVLIENIQREDLNPVEEALAYRRLLEEFAITQEDVARRVGKSRSAVTNALRLLSLPLQVQEMLSAGLISAGHARALAALDSAARQVELAQKAVAAGLSVRGLEDEVRRVLDGGDEDDDAGEGDSAAAGSRRKAVDEHLKALARDAGKQLRAPVYIRGSRNKGRIEIGYAGPEEFERLMRLLLG